MLLFITIYSRDVVRKNNAKMELNALKLIATDQTAFGASVHSNSKENCVMRKKVIYIKRNYYTTEYQVSLFHSFVTS